MIVKLWNGKNTVLFDEIDYVEYRDLQEKEPLACLEGYLDFTTGNEGKRIELWFINKNQTQRTQVVACPPVYLMNNEGKTIEKLGL